ncbi:XrtB/PEP-CTERM-associated transcriptional regulator EpsA [Comamonas flocculans]|uniref:Transcriptional regulator EpsA n=1 Tax=Comamonas flocculans TaxID=2597701 RepID=A0A5B8RSJ5_9BURK|nr:XrtB/PEP-CTERM-associated transcriptional regulator EpsA [Comamonas flocculans]QEA12470.1 transcriptional regulator EpsA [Comamonas flocculans]
MPLLGRLSVEELGHLLEAMQHSLKVDSHYALFNWLRNDVQRLLPHEIVIAAWGDFSIGLVCHDVVSSLQGMRTRSFSNEALRPFTCSLFKRWIEHGSKPFINETLGDSAFQRLDDDDTVHTFTKMHVRLVHGIKDQRGRHDCLYVLLSDDAPDDRDKKLASLRFLLPYIDASFRQIAHLPGQYYKQPLERENGGRNPLGAEVATASMPAGELSVRELEIMEWVRQGKTNPEIGMILDISAFTVKNHMQRIFKKLDVLNRTQAVAKIDTYRHAAATQK